MIKTTIKTAVVVASATLLFSSCRKTDAVSAPDIFTNFESSAQGLVANENNIIVKVKLTAAARTDIPVIINVTETGAVAGTDYTTTPAIIAGKIQLFVPSGNKETSFIVNKVAGRLFDGDEKLIFDLYSTGNPAIIGVSKQFTLTFAELVATSTGTIVIPGGGATYSNKVFIDISATRATAVSRTNWDLGFYSGPEFRVTLNSSVNMMVKPINKTDLNTVTAADTVGLTHDLGFSQTNPQNSQMGYYDYPNGDLAKTAIKEISANALENKVYIVNRGNGIGAGAASRGWRKIRIIRNATGGYTLQHAAIDATTFTSVDIDKDEQYFFKYASFETGVLTVEPQQKKWDIAWSYFANNANFPGLGEVPYMYQDIITLNRRVSVAKVLTSFKSYDAFAATDIATQTFLTAQNAIAADWRAGGGPSAAPAVQTDRYYIIKDGEGNYYKLKFTALTNAAGERGFPTFEATWLKKD